MRSLWLASAAVIISAGVACAQTAGPASSAGPTTATPLTDSGSSGTTATPPPAGGSPSMAPPMASSTGATTAKPLTDSGSSGSANTPSNTGAATGNSSTDSSSTGTTATPPASPSAAPDMAPATPVASTATPMHHHHYYSATGAAVPANGTAQDYLHYAKIALKHHNKAGADDALAKAETRLLNGVVPQGQIAPDTSPAISSIETARKDAASGDTAGANAAIDAALSSAGGGEMSSSTPASAPSSTMASSTSPVPNSQLSNKSPGQMGLAPAANETSDSAAAGGPSHPGAAPISSPPTP